MPGWEAFVIGALVLGFWLALVPVQEAVSPFVALAPPLAWAWLLFRLMGGVLVVPICEELAFRGYLFRRIRNPNFEKPSASPGLLAYVLSSIAFGVLHADVLAGIGAGLAYAWVSTRRGGLSNAIVAHAVTNLGLAIRAIGWQEWWLW